MAGQGAAPGMAEPCFVYGEAEVNYLKARDARLGAAMDEIGMLRRPVRPDLFEALIHSIVNQQVSSEAGATVWRRMQGHFGAIAPAVLCRAGAAEVQKLGTSMRKAEYMVGAAEAVASGTLDLDALRTLPDDEVCLRLCELRGVGEWTAEMLMLFSMQRPNIFSYRDLAIHRGLRMLYRHRTVPPALFEKYRRRYAPYASVASLYLWAISAGACSGLTDCAKKQPQNRGPKARK